MFCDLWPFVGPYTVYLWPLKAYTTHNLAVWGGEGDCVGVGWGSRADGDGGNGATMVGETTHLSKMGGVQWGRQRRGRRQGRGL